MKRKKNDKQIILKLIKLGWRYQKKYITLLLLISIPKIFLPFVTLLSLQTILNSGQEKNFVDLIFVMCVYFGALLITNIINTAFEYIQGVFKVKSNYTFNCMLIDKSMELSLADYENSMTYDKLQRALKETQTPYNCIISMINIFNSSVALLGSLLILILWKWYIVLVIMVVPFISFFFTVLIGRFEFKVLQERVADIRKINYFRMLINDVKSCKENKVLDTEGVLYSKFKILFEEFISKDKKILTYKSTNAIIFKLLETLVGIVIICFVIYSFTMKIILVGTANTYIRCIWNVISNMESLINNIAKIFNKAQYLDNLFSFLEQKNSGSGILKINQTRISKIETIEFRDVCFKYRKDLSYAIKDINLKLRKGEKVVIVGDNGSGKSTFLKIVSNLYEKYDGEILVNDIPLNQIDRASFNSNLSVVHQDFVKYEFTLRDNLKFGNENILEKFLDESVCELNEAGVLEFLHKLKFGLDTQLGSKFEQGVQLSGGEWQQVAFARAILRNSDLLILDEPSSALDVVTEENMYKILEKKHNEKISLLVTHRLYNITKFAERAIVFKNGMIIEDDNIEKLLSYNSYFKYLVDKTNSDNVCHKVSMEIN